MVVFGLFQTNYMAKFDLQKALAGEKVETESGLLAVNFKHNPKDLNYPVHCQLFTGYKYVPAAFTIEGQYLITSTDDWDLIMVD